MNLIASIASVRRLILLLAFAGSTITLLSCSANVRTQINKTYPPLDYREEFFVLGINDSLPASATSIGVVRVFDSGFSGDCNWDAVIQLAIQESRKAGGNAMKIIDHLPPSFFRSSCHQIMTIVLRVESKSDLALLKAQKKNPNLAPQP